MKKMGKKRKNRGRGKGSKGKGNFVQCCSCGAVVPRDKAKKVMKRTSMLDPTLTRELRKQGAYIPSSTRAKYYCISCAVHRGISSPRQKEKRKWR